MDTQPPLSLATLRQQLDAYLDTVIDRGYSPRTQEAYRERLRPFVDWCELRDVRYAPQVSLALLESWQRYLRSYRKADGQYYTHGGLINRLSALRGWFRWLLKRHHILYNPAELLTLPKEEKRLPAQVLNEAETEAVLMSIDIQTPLGLRDRAMLEVLWSTGIRRSELIHLKLDEVDSGRGVIVVRQGKGRKDRVVPIGERALSWVNRYLADVRPRLAWKQDSGYLFITLKGQPLARSTVTLMAGKVIREQARLNKPGACHLFRHSMATQMLENGADTRHIQAILGHEKLETTQIYTRVAIGHLKAVHHQTHPAERDANEQLDTSPTNADTEPPKSRAGQDAADGTASDPHIGQGGQPDRPR
ncbi:site-specific tyrosine recombinase XerC [Xenorhabdus sp. M]|uniref:Site-specific tyrosine recombinase XerC n=1 Tax=Xenorhabdus szentirmaii TaxID=290112 RepID=A0AAW3YXE9_9GAMM|nr:site-specific tyrosine recombinase XerC [Xenorhabdus sp. M]MBD2802823.1 site-specific tyrosine recombinase XerC [Xenorhabdus sp. M]